MTAQKKIVIHHHQTLQPHPLFRTIFVSISFPIYRISLKIEEQKKQLLTTKK